MLTKLDPGTFRDLMNVACTVIIFALYLSALTVAGWSALQWGRNRKRTESLPNPPETNNL
ncbi:MAG: hypothetical protein JO069_00115 [Verrucomicrobia bacterium]|nr:hypothetical protein [Verrucomicrobiota bacterium]